MLLHVGVPLGATQGVPKAFRDSLGRTSGSTFKQFVDKYKREELCKTLARSARVALEDSPKRSSISRVKLRESAPGRLACIEAWANGLQQRSMSHVSCGDDQHSIFEP